MISSSNSASSRYLWFQSSSLCLNKLLLYRETSFQTLVCVDFFLWSSLRAMSLQSFSHSLGITFCCFLTHFPWLKERGKKDSWSSQQRPLINASVSFNLSLNNAAMMCVCVCVHTHMESVIWRLISLKAHAHKNHACAYHTSAHNNHRKWKTILASFALQGHTSFSGKALSRVRICAPLARCCDGGVLDLPYSLCAWWSWLLRLWRLGLGRWCLLSLIGHFGLITDTVEVRLLAWKNGPCSCRWVLSVFPSKCKFEEAPTPEKDSVLFI